MLDALTQHDLKRLLAYHMVENIGIIPWGWALPSRSRNGLAPAGCLAVTAALFHASTTAFKSLLFFGAGAVQTATGERDMDHLGG